MDIETVEFPKWIEPHASHIDRKTSESAPAHVSVIDFESFHVNRVDGTVTVMVTDADEEKRALAAYEAPKEELKATDLLPSDETAIRNGL